METEDGRRRGYVREHSSELVAVVGGRFQESAGHARPLVSPRMWVLAHGQRRPRTPSSTPSVVCISVMSVSCVRESRVLHISAVALKLALCVFSNTFNISAVALSLETWRYSLSTGVSYISCRSVHTRTYNVDTGWTGSQGAYPARQRAPLPLERRGRAFRRLPSLAHSRGDPSLQLRVNPIGDVVVVILQRSLRGGLERPVLISGTPQLPEPPRLRRGAGLGARGGRG